MNLFKKKPPVESPAVDGEKKAPAPEPGEMALDTLAGILRSIAEFALEQDKVDLAAFRQIAESWAQHVAVGVPAPGAPLGGPAGSGRRDWQGVRQFVRDYCRASSTHATSITSDLREVIWTFIRNFSQAFAQDEDTDERIQQQMARLEKLIEESAAAELKREVLSSIGTITQAFEERRQRQRQRVTDLGETVRSLGDQLRSARLDTETDPLTRVANRKALDVYLQQTVEMHQAFRQHMCLLLIDVDEFKQVNDGHGHAVGDQVLRCVADGIVKVFLRKNDFVARFGGDEFAVILRETALEDAVMLGERLLARIRAIRVPAGERTVRVSVSLGVAGIEVADSVSTWFERADRALYAAKGAGRDRVASGKPGASPASDGDRTAVP